jgi:hypothetical protein
MITPAQYQHQLADLKIDILDKPLTSKVDAQAALTEINALKDHLLQMEQSLNLDLHVLRSQFQARRAAAEAGSSSRIMVSAKHRVGGSQRVDEENKLAAERDEKLAPFQELKSQVTELLDKVEAARSAAEKLTI